MSPPSELLQGPTQGGRLAGWQGRGLILQERGPREPAVLRSDPEGPFTHTSQKVCAQQLHQQGNKRAPSRPSDSAGAGNLAANTDPD